LKVAFYGRYSSDNQRDTSIEDQQRVVERWAERTGHEIVARFSDSAVSGANLRLLSGLRRAVEAACRFGPAENYGNVPDFTLADRTGRTVTRHDFLDKISVVDLPEG
jgi:hypothetical protein